MAAANIRVERSGDGVLAIELDRAEKHNAFDEALIAELTAAFRDVAGDDVVRIGSLTGRGPSFSAGADLGWMKRMAALDQSANEKDALALSDLMAAIDGCPKPVVGLINGAAFGGGVGLVACCDIAIASEEATFALTEVRLGLIPAVISPNVAAAIGARQCRRWFLSAERFDARRAEKLGLVHKVVPPGELGSAGQEMIGHLLKGGPGSQAAAKDLIRLVTGRQIDDRLRQETAKRIARQRASAEGKEGIGAFLEKRKPSWQEA